MVRRLLVWKHLSRGGQIYIKKSNSYLKILGAITVTQRKFITQEPQILVAKLQNSVVRVTLSLGFVHPCPKDH